MIEVLKQALEVLEFDSLYGTGKQEAITSLRKAIKELESQEPIKWSDYEPNGMHHNKPAPRSTWVGSGDLEDSNAYLDPPQEQQSCDKRTWVGLTDEEFWELDKEDLSLRQFVQAVDDRLKEKNT